ncbi:MAG: DUF4359 domain-containing protein [Prevotella sp.]|nr:DUF4359 domain-containing protein [Prevotella sp.]
MKKIITIVICAAVLLGMVITNPKKEAHTEAIAANYKDAIQEKIGVLSAFAPQTALEGAVNNTVTVSDYVFLSVGKYSMNEGMNSIVSVGVFNHVFVLTKDNILEEILRSIGLNI